MVNVLQMIGVLKKKFELFYHFLRQEEGAFIIYIYTLFKRYDALFPLVYVGIFGLFLVPKLPKLLPCNSNVIADPNNFQGYKNCSRTTSESPKVGVIDTHYSDPIHVLFLLQLILF